MSVYKKAIRWTARGLGFAAGIGGYLFVRGVVYRFTGVPVSRFDRIGIWAFALGTSIALEQWTTKIFMDTADLMIQELEK